MGSTAELERPSAQRMNSHKSRFLTPVAAVLAGALFLANQAVSQLAITEVMALGSDRSGAETVPAGPDWWELTNLGTNDIDLTGYTFSDISGYNHPPRADTAPVFRDRTIRAGESIIFFRDWEYTSDGQLFVDQSDFSNWWWGDPSRESPRAFSWPRHNLGLSDVHDAVQLFDPSGGLVDYVEWWYADQGCTLVTSSTSGEFSQRSIAGVDGAFPAATKDDIGSPGFAGSPLPLSILEHPTNIETNAGLEVCLRVRAAGLPRPKYQWFFNGNPITGAREPTFRIPAVLESHSGEYSVQVSNFFAVLTSSSAVVRVHTNEFAPVAVLPSTNCVAFDGRKAKFKVVATGYPLPTLQWFTNGLPITGATNDSIRLVGVSLSQSGAKISVQVSNRLGSTNVAAHLTVLPLPNLQITEVMPTISGDWFELTNFDTNSVRLQGFRVFDRQDLTWAFVITNDICMRPYESVIFLSGIMPDDFVKSWGVSNLPSNLQLILDAPAGLSESGDTLNLWDPNEDDSLQPIVSAEWAGTTSGFSLDCVNDRMCGCDSVPGTNGAFFAALSSDIGGPGYTRASFRGVNHDTNRNVVRLVWPAVTNKVYRIWCASVLDVCCTAWNIRAVIVATNPPIVFEDDLASAQRFYRLEELP